MEQRKGSHFLSCFSYERERRKKKKRAFNLLSLILEVLSVRIRRAKSESLSTQRGLCVGTKKEGFHRRSKGEIFGKSKILGYGGFPLMLSCFKR